MYLRSTVRDQNITQYFSSFFFKLTQMDPNSPGPRKSPYKDYKPTPAEAQTIGECTIEATFYRAIPLSLGLGASTWYAVKAGVFRANRKWGAIPKVTLAVAAGYIIGYASYMPTCARRIMALPDSPLAAILKERVGYAPVEPEQPGDTRLSLDAPISNYEPPVEVPKGSETFVPLPSQQAPKDLPINRRLRAKVESVEEQRKIREDPKGLKESLSES